MNQTTTMVLLGALALAPSMGAPAHQDSAAPVPRRIDSSRITESTPPPLPDVIVQPLPAQHRIAKRAEETGLDDARFKAASAAIARGLDWLASQQAPNGSWMSRAKATPTDEPDKPTSVTIAVSALVVKSLAQADSHQEALDRGVDALLRDTGTIQSFAPGDEGRLGTYVAAAVCSALASIDDPAVLDRRDDAITWLKSEQWASEDGLDPSQDWFGGAGYGTRERPDLSNTQMMLDALHDAGVSPEDPAVQRALIFVSRTQNLARTNDASWSTDGSNDGGFIYTPANGGESMASEYAGEGRRGELIPVGTPRSLRSYGSMTYAGFKSLLYAGLTREDPRVQAAFEWIRAHWTFEENPGLGQQGRFYYLHAAARALAAAQSATITTPDGTAHAWRAELVDAILAEQREDGSWANEAPRWLEGEPVLATAYALLALEEALKPAIEVEVPPDRPQGDFSKD